MRHDDALLPEPEIAAFLSAHPGWEEHGGWLVRTYQSKGWSGSMLIVGAISFLAEAADHHPDLEVHWGSVVVRLQTHTVAGVTTRDTALAGEIERTISRTF